MKENNNGKDLLKILQENYEIEIAQDLSGAIKDLFKEALQQMMNAEFDSSMGYSKYDKMDLWQVLGHIFLHTRIIFFYLFQYWSFFN